METTRLPKAEIDREQSIAEPPNPHRFTHLTYPELIRVLQDFTSVENKLLKKLFYCREQFQSRINLGDSEALNCQCDRKQRTMRKHDYNKSNKEF